MARAFHNWNIFFFGFRTLFTQGVWSELFSWASAAAIKPGSKIVCKQFCGFFLLARCQDQHYGWRHRIHRGPCVGSTRAAAHQPTPRPPLGSSDLYLGQPFPYIGSRICRDGIARKMANETPFYYRQGADKKKSDHWCTVCLAECGPYCAKKMFRNHNSYGKSDQQGVSSK